MHAPQEIYWQAAHYVLAYLKHVSRCDLLYLLHSRLCLEAYSEFSYASNHSDRKSISGYCTLVDRNLFTWQSQKLHVSLSSAEDEYHSMMHASSNML